MAGAFKISQAASLALHTMTLLAANGRKALPTREIAGKLDVSEAHLSKVLQRLVRAGLVGSTRGPGGGFTIRKGGGGLSLLEVYECIEGPFDSQKCLLGVPSCDSGECILGDLLETVNKEVHDYLSKTKLHELKGVYRNGGGAD